MAAVVTTRRRVRIPTAGTVRRIVQAELRDLVERKMLDTNRPQATGTSSTPVLTLLSAIGQGDDYYQRTGQQVTCSRLYVRWAAFFNQAAAATTVQTIRHMIVLDTAANGAQMTASGSAPLGLFVAAAPQIDDQRNALTTNRYLVLYDETIWVNNAHQSIKYGDFSVNLRNHINFDGTGGAIANQLNNALWLITYSDAAANVPTYGFTSRLWYYDA